MPAIHRLFSRLGRRVYRAVRRFLVCDITRLMILQIGHPARGDARGWGKKTPAPSCSGGQLVALGAEQVQALAQDPGNDLDPAMASRLCGDLDACLGIMLDGRLACYAWYAFGSVEGIHNRGREKHSGTALSFPPNVAFLYKGFTRCEYRGLGLYGRLHQLSADWLAQHGIDSVLTTADWANDAALNSCRGSGFRKLGTIVRTGWQRRVVGFYPKLDPALGIRFGRKAQVAARPDTSGRGEKNCRSLPGGGKGWMPTASVQRPG